jgi:hypothetical protein
MPLFRHLLHAVWPGCTKHLILCFLHSAPEPGQPDHSGSGVDGESLQARVNRGFAAVSELVRWWSDAFPSSLSLARLLLLLMLDNKRSSEQFRLELVCVSQFGRLDGEN